MWQSGSGTASDQIKITADGTAMFASINAVPQLLNKVYLLVMAMLLLATTLTNNPVYEVYKGGLNGCYSK